MAAEAKQVNGLADDVKKMDINKGGGGKGASGDERGTRPPRRFNQQRRFQRRNRRRGGNAPPAGPMTQQEKYNKWVLQAAYLTVCNEKKWLPRSWHLIAPRIEVPDRAGLIKTWKDGPIAEAESKMATLAAEHYKELCRDSIKIVDRHINDLDTVPEGAGDSKEQVGPDFFLVHALKVRVDQMAKDTSSEVGPLLDSIKKHAKLIDEALKKDPEATREPPPPRNSSGERRRRRGKGSEGDKDDEEGAVNGNEEA